MPKVGSWNGKWTGAEKNYTEIRRVRNDDKDFAKCKQLVAQKNHQYDFGDGWVMNIEVKEIYFNQLKKALRESDGFCGYSWAVDSLIKRGYIISDRDLEIQKENEIAAVMTTM
jgi:hypothetical protein